MPKPTRASAWRSLPSDARRKPLRRFSGPSTLRLWMTASTRCSARRSLPPAEQPKVSRSSSARSPSDTAIPPRERLTTPQKDRKGLRLLLIGSALLSGRRSPYERLSAIRTVEHVLAYARSLPLFCRPISSSSASMSILCPQGECHASTGDDPVRMSSRYPPAPPSHDVRAERNRRNRH